MVLAFARMSSSVKLIDYDNFEVVVIDNCSSDNSIKYIEKIILM